MTTPKSERIPYQDVITFLLMTDHPVSTESDPESRRQIQAEYIRIELEKMGWTPDEVRVETKKRAQTTTTRCGSFLNTLQAILHDYSKTEKNT
jgi:hypothetical protein